MLVEMLFLYEEEMSFMIARAVPLERRRLRISLRSGIGKLVGNHSKNLGKKILWINTCHYNGTDLIDKD